MRDTPGKPPTGQRQVGSSKSAFNDPSKSASYQCQMGIQIMPSTTGRLMPNAQEHVEVQHGALLPMTDGSSTLIERAQAKHSSAPI